MENLIIGASWYNPVVLNPEQVRLKFESSRGPLFQMFPATPYVQT